MCLINSQIGSQTRKGDKDQFELGGNDHIRIRIYKKS